MENVNGQKQDTTLVHSFQNQNNSGMISQKFIITLVIVAVLGIGVGFLLSRNQGTLSAPGLGGLMNKSGAPAGTIVGVKDTKGLDEPAEGTLKEGGIDGEGQYHLIRPGGDSQTVYLTSATLDLSKYVGGKVKVWGKTQAAQKAGWLLDVSRLEVLQ